MFGAWVTTDVGQRIVRRPAQLPAPVKFNLSQLGRTQPSMFVIDKHHEYAVAFFEVQQQPMPDGKSGDARANHRSTIA